MRIASAGASQVRQVLRWREAMAAALYGPAGFFTGARGGPAAHFRTSTHTSPQFAGAIGRLLTLVDEALDRPDPLTVVDVGAGRGELLSALARTVAPGLAARLRPVAVELAPRPDRLATTIDWQATRPDGVTGLLLATEWLDNVPVEIAEVDADGEVRYVLVDPATGEEALGEPVSRADADWLARWWPIRAPGARAEIGRSRDEAWAGAVASVTSGAALAVDYGHLAGARPPLGTLTGFRQGREVPPVPDGSRDLTVDVALDAVAHAGGFALHTYTQHYQPPDGVYVCRANAGASRGSPALVRQAGALRALGVTGARPSLALAHRDPTGYLRQLAAASAATELTDPAGLGGHYWLLQPVALPEPADVTGWLA